MKEITQQRPVPKGQHFINRMLQLTVMLILTCATATAQEVFKNTELTITPLEQGVWVVETADMTTMYIVEGTERALLIDTGTKCDSLDKIVRRITAKP
ncbi:MAG: hypothetical protein LBG31_00680, partial [Prevotellaceae bacterium]|nr:hypothetical protein [Prevotellaceae bacterium]